MVHENSEWSYLGNASRLWRHTVWTWVLCIQSWTCRVKKEFSLIFSICSDSGVLIYTNEVLMKITCKCINLLGYFSPSSNSSGKSHQQKCVWYLPEKTLVVRFKRSIHQAVRTYSIHFYSMCSFVQGIKFSGAPDKMFFS